MMRLIAYLLFGIGIIAAIVGGAKLPAKQVEFLTEEHRIKDQIADVDNQLTGKDKLSTEQVKELKQQKNELEKTVKELSGWPPQNNGERFSNAIPVFCVGVGIALAGIVLWRNDIRDRRVLAAESEKLDADLSETTEATTSAIDTAPGYLKSVQPAMATLTSTMKNATHDDLLEMIDGVLSDHVTPFVERRERLIEERGLARAAPVMLHMATGERLLNRAWSAEADGYRHESLDAIDEATIAFQDALNELEDQGDE